MSAIVLQVEWTAGGRPDGLQRLTTALERAGAELADVGKHILPKLLPLLETETGKQFDAEGGGPASGSWAPLTLKYAKWKEAHFPGQPTLVRRGALKAALTGEHSPGALRSISGGTLSYGTTGIPYASFHQTGTKAPSGITRAHTADAALGAWLGRGAGMPARPPFDFGPDFEAGMQAAAMAGVREAVRAAGDGLLDFEGDTFEGQSVLTGKSGGKYIVREGGGKTYLRQGPSGNVIKRNFR